MSRLTWLAENAPPEALPPAQSACLEPNGLLAAGGSLDPDWLLHAYAHGAFPWYNPGEPILWWSPDPRAVLRPDEFRRSRSLRRTIRSGTYRVCADTSFGEVISGCAAPRAGGEGTWITNQMHSAYVRLHALGYAHSFEAWHGERLVGGLYGVAIGRVFFGESMFTRADNASKVAFAAATDFLNFCDFELIDCQVPSAHLASLGATAMARSEFLAELQVLCSSVRMPGAWTDDFARWYETD
ncbi:MAG: leucyl/phenylalanyl-tRNA--protein transferase [Gammaproteobacteria bacterium]|jgi:leucyl/phenylalanyl-tRNA--protein transferase